MEIEKNYLSWLGARTSPDSILTDDELRKKVEKELTFLRSLSVEEYTLLKKWRKMNRIYPPKIDKSEIFFTRPGSKPHYPEIEALRDRIWIPKEPNDYEQLQPIITQCDKNTVKFYNKIKFFISSGLGNSKMGRNLFFLVTDKVTDKLLGIINITSDFMALTPRDKYISWTQSDKETGMLNHTAIGSTIIPTQPLGYSYLGGKLLALLCLSDVVECAWKERYHDTLVGITTTSLYSSFSQYNSLMYWKHCGHSAGTVRYEPISEILSEMLEWLSVQHPLKFWKWYIATRDNGLPLLRDHKQRALNFIYKELGFKGDDIETGHSRGIYFASLYKNSCDYLRHEITEDKLIRRFDNSPATLINIWKEKYAKKRVNDLLEQGRYSNDILWYGNMIGTTWEEAKELYLKDIGR